MVSRAECHLRIDDDVIFSLGNIIVESAVDDTAVSDDDGLEEVLFPFFVPVFIFGFHITVFYLCVGQGKVGKCLFEDGFAIKFFLYVSGDAVGLLDKTFKAGFAQDAGKYIVDYFCTRNGAECKILNISSEYDCLLNTEYDS